MDDLVISSFNCQGLGNQQKRRDIFHYLKQKSFSIYCLQDTHFDRKMEKYIQSEWGYKAYFASYKTNSRGVAVLFNNNFEFKIRSVKKDQNGNYIIISFSAMEKDLLLVNVYGPNRDSPQFYSDLLQTIKQYNNHNIIAVGDWNLVMDPVYDYYNYKHVNNPKSRLVIDTMMTELELTDVWRENNPEYRQFTWRKQTPLQQSRLDFFLLSDYLYWHYEDTDILPGYRSDHSIVTLRLSFRKQLKRNTFWKFNCSLLKDVNYVNEINIEVRDVIREYAINQCENNDEDHVSNGNVELKVPDKIFLDFLLMKVRSKTIAYATMKKKKRKENEETLIKSIEEIERRPFKTDNELKILKEKNEELVSLRNEIMKGVLLRSKARWISDGEKVTKYFCNLEKRNFISKRMDKLTNENGTTTDDTENIKEQVGNFYKQLYKRNKNVKDCKVNDLINKIPKISDEERKSLEGEITLEEAGLALKQMKNGKSPGSDGFGAEFFKFFWKQLGPFVVRALNESYRDGELSATQKEGLITCIPKGDKPKEFIKNWRPISLLNVIYKIGSTCIANRMKKILPKLIDEDQTGFVPNRYIGDNIRLIYDMMHYLETKKQPGLLLCLDFEKAFDTLDWKFMLKVLRSYNIGNSFCRWIETFYKNIKSTVIVNGQCTHWLNVERGCRQGDPVSPYLFILSVEILAIMVREDKDIKGICINNIEHKISQFADDMQLINSGDKLSFEKSMHIINRFSEVSGLFINVEKTQAVWLGTKKYSNVQYMKNLNLVWNPERFKILGLWFTQDLKACESINYDMKFSEVKTLFNIWSKRIITPLGKVAVLKSLILSKLVYLWTLLPNPPNKFIKELQNLCFQFIWSKRQDRISRKTVVQNIRNGGLGVPDIETYIIALKVTWIKKIVNTNHKWKNICFNLYPFLEQLTYYGGSLVKKYKIDNHFWLDTLYAYKTFYGKVKPSRSAELLSERVFFNEKIMVGGESIKRTDWIEKEVFCIAHFLKDNGTFLNHAEFKAKYNISINFITYAGYVSSIKNYIKNTNITVTDNQFQATSLSFKILNSCPKGSKVIYDAIISNENPPKCCMKWSQKLNSEIIWKNVFFKLHKIQDIQLKWFQIRIVHRILATNFLLKKMKIIDDDRCSFCSSQRDSIDHLLWKCDQVAQFWLQLENLLNEKCANLHNLKFNENLIIFGTHAGFKTDATFDLIVMLGKMYIYKCRLNKSIPQFSGFLKELKYRYKIEEHNAKISGLHHKFQIDWLCYKEMLKPATQN